MPMSSERLAQTLASELGAALVTPASGNLQIDGVEPALVVTPRLAEQVTGLVRVCSEAGAAMIPWGGGSAMAIGNPPRRADVVIDLRNLARIIDYDAANLTVTVEAGLTLSRMQSALAAERQFSPLAPPFAARATIGGTIAANLNGPYRARYGGVRDLVIGIKAVLASGKSIKAGGKVVKNVAGYDMSKLFVGSLGTLGVLTEATVRVAPAVEASATIIAYGTLAQAKEFARQIVQSVLLPAVVYLQGTRFSAWRVAVACEDFSEVIHRQMQELQTSAGRAGLRSEILTAEAHDDLWNQQRDFPLCPEYAIFRVVLPRSAIFDFMQSCSGWDPAAVLCDVLMGTIWLAFAPSHAAITRLPAIESQARLQHGHAVLLTAPAALKTNVNVWGSSPASFSIMREIKRQFDPLELLNPGRFVGGL